MRSSTSSFKPIERIIPKQNWLKLGGIALSLCLVLVFAWEWYWRHDGYIASLNDNKDLWALTREELDKNPRATVLIGSSRMLFGFNLEEWEKVFGNKPIQLATVATNPTVYLHHLANETKFSGVLIMDVVPMVFFAPEGAPIDIPKQNINHYKNFSLAQRWSHYIGVPLDRNLAFLETEDLSLKNLIKSLNIPDRKSADIPPPVPPFFMEIEKDRQGKMIHRVETDENLRQRLKDIWVNYFTPPPPPKGVSLEDHLKWFEGHMNQVIKQVTKDMETIKNRGGKIIMVRFPSTGRVKKLELKYTPRAQFWDRIVNETKPDFSIYHNDYKELKGFDCPEESHLNREGAHRFTRGLIKIIRESEIL